LGQQAFQIISRDGLSWLQCEKFSRLRWVAHAFSTRCGGVSHPPCAGLNLGFADWDQREKVEDNRRLFLASLGAGRFCLAWLRQTHSDHAYQVGREADGKLSYTRQGSGMPEPEGRVPPAGDALLTDKPAIMLSVRSADCLTVLLLDPKRRAVGAVHAGWRGALARIIEKTVGDMRVRFQTDPRGLLAAVGPSIRACCYEVGEEVVEAFQGRFARSDRFFRREPAPTSGVMETRSSFLETAPPGQGTRVKRAIHLDLVAVAREQLLSGGVSARNIFVADFCTSCRTDLFFSHRKEGGKTGRMMAVIGIRPEG
jgi:polyphenol oxidase